MRIKKVVILFGIIIALCMALTGCGTKENEVKKIEKEADVASIKDLEKDNKNDTNENVSKQDNENTIKENDNNNQTATHNGEIYGIKYTNMTADNGNYIIVYAYGKNNNTIWEYRTKTDTTGGQFSNLEFIKYDAKNGSVIINELGTIKALDAQTAKEKWSIEGHKCYNTKATIDDEGTIYLYAFEPQRLFIIDKNGNILKNLDMQKLANMLSDGEDLPVSINGIDSIELSSETKGTIVVFFRYTSDYEEEGKMISREFTKKMNIDTVNESIIIGTEKVVETEI